MRLFLMLLIVILLVGCVPQTTYLGDRVDIQINSPADKIRIGYPIVPTVHVENQGEADAEGSVCVTGSLSDKFKGYGGCDCMDSYNLIVEKPGEDREAILYGERYNVISGAEGEYILTFYNKYKYKTFADLGVCLKLEPSKKTGCVAEGNAMVSSSRGPVEIKSVEQEIQPLGGDSLILILEYEIDAGSDPKQKIVSEEAMYSCFYDDPNDPEVRVFLEVLEERYECDTIEVRNGEGGGSCVVEISATGPYGDYLFAEEKTFDGTLELQYVWEERKTVEFSVE